ncbi:hypothetical protein FCV25MIE_29664 [Fagus crenata]
MSLSLDSFFKGTLLKNCLASVPIPPAPDGFCPTPNKVQTQAGTSVLDTSKIEVLPIPEPYSFSCHLEWPTTYQVLVERTNEAVVVPTKSPTLFVEANCANHEGKLVNPLDQSQSYLGLPQPKVYIDPVIPTSRTTPSPSPTALYPLKSNPKPDFDPNCTHQTHYPPSDIKSLPKSPSDPISPSYINVDLYSHIPDSSPQISGPPSPLKRKSLFANINASTDSTSHPLSTDII